MARGKRQRYILYGVMCAFVFVVLFLGQKIPRDAYLTQKVIEASAPVLKVFREPLLFVQQLGDDISYYFFVVEENRSLHKENALLKGWRNEALYLRRENTDLHNLLKIAEKNTINPIVGRVLADTRRPYGKTVIIDVGAEQAVKKGQAVLSENGLAGRILGVSQTTARVLLLQDYNAYVPVKFLKTGTLAIARGDRGGAMDLMLSENPMQTEEGELVVTSGVGGVFSQGLPVGVVRHSNAGYKLKPHTDFSKLDKVVVHRRSVAGIIPDDLSSSNLSSGVQSVGSEAP